MFNISAANSQTTALGVICRQRTVPMCELIGMSYLDVSGLLAVVDFIVHFNLKSVGKTLHRPGIEPYCAYMRAHWYVISGTFLVY